jgi:hypothetical protein
LVQLNWLVKDAYALARLTSSLSQWFNKIWLYEIISTLWVSAYRERIVPSQSLYKGLCKEVNQSIGLILMDDQARVLGMSARALQILNMEPGRLGRSVLDYHDTHSRVKVSEFLLLSEQSRPEAPVAMIIDVLGKVITIALAPMIMAGTQETSFRVATIMDVTEATGAVVEPASGQVRISNFPVCQDGSFVFLDSSSVFYFRVMTTLAAVF